MSTAEVEKHIYDMTEEELEKHWIDIASRFIARMHTIALEDLEETRKIAEFNERQIFAAARGKVSDRLSTLVEEIIKR